MLRQTERELRKEGELKEDYKNVCCAHMSARVLCELGIMTPLLFFSFPSPPPLPLTYPKPSSSSISLILPYPTYLSIFYPLHSPHTSVLHKVFCWLKGTDRSLTTSLTADKHPTYRCSAWCQSTGQSLSLEGRPDSRKKATYTIQPNYDSNQC